MDCSGTNATICCFLKSYLHTETKRLFTNRKQSRQKTFTSRSGRLSVMVLKMSDQHKRLTLIIKQSGGGPHHSPEPPQSCTPSAWSCFGADLGQLTTTLDRCICASRYQLVYGIQMLPVNICRFVFK